MSVAVDPAVAAPTAGARIGLRRGRTWILAGSDLLALVLAYAFTYVVAEQLAPPAVVAPTGALVVLALVAGPLWIAAFTAYHLYDNDHRRISIATLDEVQDVFHALVAGSLGFLILAQVLLRVADWRIYSAVEAALFTVAGLALVPLARATTRSLVFPRVMGRRRTLIVGGGREAELVYRKLERHPEYGLEVVGFAVADGERPPGDVVGRASDLDLLVEQLDVDRVLIASAAAAHDEMLDLIRSVRRPDLQVSIVPRYSEIFTAHAMLDDVEGMPVVSLPQMGLGRSSRLLKRSFDVLVAGGVLLLLSPLLALIALAIRIDSEGSSIYRQPRRGRDGTTFRIAKFRTMYVGAEAQRASVLRLNDVDGPLFKVKNGADPRVTRIGGFLRRTSLDELPQLWNVVRGEMSLVGPRPFVIYEADQITGWASRRLEMTPGITGLWQVLGRNDIPFEEMVKLDYLYVTNWSLWWDIKILCQTVPVVFAGKGAY